MNTQTLTALAAVSAGIVIAGQWAKGKKINPRTVLSLLFIGFVVSLLYQGEPELAVKISALILAAIVIAYVPTLVKKGGLTK